MPCGGWRTRASPMWPNWSRLQWCRGRSRVDSKRNTMSEFLKQSGFLGTHATMGADISQLMATVFTALFVIGWLQARQRQGHAHHWLMLSGMIAMLAFFTSY